MSFRETLGVALFMATAASLSDKYITSDSMEAFSTDRSQMPTSSRISSQFLTSININQLAYLIACLLD